MALSTRPSLDPNSPENLKIMTAATVQPPYVYYARVAGLKPLSNMLLS